MSVGVVARSCVLVQHFGGVNALALSPDGEQLFTGSRDTSIKGCGSCTYHLKRAKQGYEAELKGTCLATACPVPGTLTV